MSDEQYQQSTFVRKVWNDYKATQLLEVSTLAHALGVGRIFLKLENERPLGSFKSLGGVFAGLRALARYTGKSVEDLLAGTHQTQNLPELTCASDGNHGLAVATAAKRAGSHAVIFLPEHVSKDRAARIEAMGGRIVRVNGTYDEAVRRAEAFADEGSGLLVPDTTQDKSSEVVKDIMAGYSLIADELREQFDKLGHAPTHFFIPAGVGGLAAAMAAAFMDVMSNPRAIIAVEPENAACVGAALNARRPVLVDGDLATTAEMLSCGLVSAPALEILLQRKVRAIAVNEPLLEKAVDMLHEFTSLRTTPSGAAGLAGALAIAEQPELRTSYFLDEQSSVLIPITERSVATQN